MKLSQLKETVKRNRAIVLGHGQSAQWFINAPLRDEGILLVGVNDHEDVFGWEPDVLVVLDSAARFNLNSEERALCVMNTKAPYVVTQQSQDKLPLTYSKRVEVTLNNLRGIVKLDDPDYLSISLTSPFVGVQVAYHLGAKNIEVFGVDLEGHHLYGRKKEIMKHFEVLFAELAKLGCNARFGKDVPLGFHTKEEKKKPKKK